MKKICAVAVMIVAVAGFAFTDSQFRLAANFSTDFTDKPTLEEVRTAFDVGTDVLSGFHWEVILDRTGFGMHYQILFERLDTYMEDPVYDWAMDWMGDGFVSYHFFGAGSFLDPFLEIGLGSAGRVNIDSDSGQWVKDEEGDWEYVLPEWDPASPDGLTNLGLYGYVAAGLALDFDGLLLGTRFAYRPFVRPVPATDFPEYPLKSFQVSLFGGIAFGAH